MTRQKKKPAETLCYIRGRNHIEINRRIETVIDHARKINEDWLSDTASKTAQESVHKAESGTAIALDQMTLDDVAHELIIHHDRLDKQDKLYGLSGLVSDSEPDHVKHVVVPSTDHVAVQDFRAVELMTVNDVQVHIVNDGIAVHDIDPDTMYALETLTNAPKTTPDGIKHTGGRPPIGFKVEDGILQPGDDYDHVCRVLDSVRHDRLTDQEAASRLGCVRKTIHNALDRPEMYQLS